MTSRVALHEWSWCSSRPGIRDLKHRTEQGLERRDAKMSSQTAAEDGSFQTERILPGKCRCNAVALKGRNKKGRNKKGLAGRIGPQTRAVDCFALSGLAFARPDYPGRRSRLTPRRSALGSYVAAPIGAKEMSKTTRPQAPILVAGPWTKPRRTGRRSPSEALRPGSCGRDPKRCRATRTPIIPKSERGCVGHLL